MEHSTEGRLPGDPVVGNPHEQRVAREYRSIQAHDPEGLDPSPRARRLSTLAVWFAALVGVGVVVGLGVAGGWPAVWLVVALLATFVALSMFPVWFGARERVKDRHRAEHEARARVDEDERGGA